MLYYECKYRNTHVLPSYHKVCKNSTINCCIYKRERTHDIHDEMNIQFSFIDTTNYLLYIVIVRMCTLFMNQYLHARLGRNGIQVTKGNKCNISYVLCILFMFILLHNLLCISTGPCICKCFDGLLTGLRNNKHSVQLKMYLLIQRIDV